MAFAIITFLIINIDFWCFYIQKGIGPLYKMFISSFVPVTFLLTIRFLLYTEAGIYIVYKSKKMQLNTCISFKF